MDYKINDVILYGADGICKIGEITEREIDSSVYKYCILHPVFDKKSTIFVPLANKSLVGKMRDLPTEPEVDAALEAVLSKTETWISSDSKRKETLKEVIEFGTVYQLLAALKLLYIHRDFQNESGKKLHVADEHIMKDIEKVLLDILSYIKDMERASAKDFLKEHLVYLIV